MPAERWLGDAGDVVASLWPHALADQLNVIATATLNSVLAVCGVEQQANVAPMFTAADAARFLDGEYLTDPAQYTAMAGPAA